MDIDALRAIDHYVGLPLCWLLTSIRWLGRPFSSDACAASVENILIIKLSEMGSTVLAYPACRELRRRFPQASLYFLTFEENRAIIEALNLTEGEKIISVGTGGFAQWVGSGIQAVWRLWKANLDATIDMDFFSRMSAALAYLVCRRRRIGFHPFTNAGLGRGNLLTHKVMYSPHVHTSIAFLSLARSLGDRITVPLYKAPVVIPNEDIPSYSPAASSVDSVKKMLAAFWPEAASRGPLVLINPNSSNIFPLRKWPLSHFSDLCDSLLKARPDVRIAVTGSADEAADADAIVHRLQNTQCVSLAGMTSFPELLALYSVADLMVTNDSGPAHFASLLNLPTLVLFGPETPRLYQPLGKACKALYAEFACSPCVSVYNDKKSPCTDNQCLQVIRPSVVLDEALSRLASIGR